MNNRQSYPPTVKTTCKLMIQLVTHVEIYSQHFSFRCCFGLRFKDTVKILISHETRKDLKNPLVPTTP